MRIKIDTNVLGPIKIIPELPDARLSIIEGLNGIGKTLAVRILELCAGSRPYSLQSSAWQSLCDGLGEFQVTATGLHGAREIQWRADSRDWSQVPDDGVSPVAFRAITIDDKPASIADVRRLLAVHRIGGEQGIVDTLADQADEAADIVHRWATRHMDARDGPLARLEAATADSLRLLGPWSSDDLQRLSRQVEQTRSAQSEATKAVEGAQQKRDRLATLVDLSNRLQELRDRAPDLKQRLEAIDHQIQLIETKREELQGRVRALAGHVAVAGPRLRELTNARRTLDRNRSSLSGYLNAAAEFAAELGIALTSEAVETLLERLAQDIADLRQQQIEFDAAPTMRGLLDQLAPPLSHAEQLGMGDQIAIDDSANALQLTVTQTRSGLLTRRAYLEGRPPPPQSQDVANRIDVAEQSRDRANRLKVVLLEVDRYRRLVAANEDRVKAAIAVLRPGALAEMQKLETQRRQNDDRLLQLAAERAALRQQLGGPGEGTSLSDLTSQLEEGLKEAGLVEPNLRPTLAETEGMLRRQLAELAQAEDDAARTRRELSHVNAEVRRATASLMGSPHLSWLRVKLAATLSDTGNLQQQAALLDQVRRLANSANDRLGEVRGQMGAVESALRGVGRHLRGQNPETARYLPQLQAWLGRHFSGWFNIPRVRQELLPNAIGEIAVDVERREVTWTERDATRSRPLDAFSSGEQAFAYTRARLAVLDEQAKPLNRLIALDEFGAFIAHDRLAGLLAYLRDRTRDHPEDQVVVILPLSRDYTQLASNALASEADAFGKLAEEIATRSYAVRLLES